MPEFRMTLVIVQQQTGTFAQAADATEELQAFSWEGATIQSLLEHYDPVTQRWHLVTPATLPRDHHALLEAIVLMDAGAGPSELVADTVAHLADLLDICQVASVADLVYICVVESRYWNDQATHGTTATTTYLTAIEAAILYLAMASDLEALPA